MRGLAGLCCPADHNAWRWHFFASACGGCDCPADSHSLILVGHPCLDCVTCPAYISRRPANPTRVERR